MEVSRSRLYKIFTHCIYTYKEASLTLQKILVILQIEQNEFLRPESGCSEI